MALNIENLSKERERLTTTGFGFRKNLVQMPEGKGVVPVRLLSSPDGDLFKGTRTHNVNGKNLHCPRELAPDGYYRGKCPICEYYNLLWKNSKTKAPEKQIMIKHVLVRSNQLSVITIMRLLGLKLILILAKLKLMLVLKF